MVEKEEDTMDTGEVWDGTTQRTPASALTWVLMPPPRRTRWVGTLYRRAVQTGHWTGSSFGGQGGSTCPWALVLLAWWYVHTSGQSGTIYRCSHWSQTECSSLMEMSSLAWRGQRSHQLGPPAMTHSSKGLGHRTGLEAGLVLTCPSQFLV